jgi:hypothetical protein
MPRKYLRGGTGAYVKPEDFTGCIVKINNLGIRMKASKAQ